MKTYRTLALLGLAALSLSIGCKPQTTSQKIEDKAEDASHEIKQGVERTQENIENTNK